MLHKKLVPLTLAVCLSSVLCGFAQTSVTSDPVGFTTTSCLSNSDTYVSIPFTRPPEFTGTIQSLTTDTMTVNGTPGWPTNQFVYAAGTQAKHYYVLLGNGSNPKEGHRFPVISNTANSLTVDTTAAGETLSGVTANTQITVIPYWTPASIFPASDANVSFTPTTSTSAYETQLLIPAVAPAGQYLYSATYFYSSNIDGSTSGWHLVGDNTTEHGDDPLSSDNYFIVRNNNNAPTLPLTAAGSVLMKALAVPLITSPMQATDNPVAIVRPVDVPLNHTGLAPGDRSFVQGDQLLLFDNATASLNKTPSKTYVFTDGWKLSPDLTTDHGNDVIPAGSAMLVRKGTSSTGTVFWTNYPTYVSGLAIQPLQVVSRLTHGANGPSFGINLPLTGTPGVECRRGGTSGKDFNIVATFPAPLTATPSATVTSVDSAATADTPVVTTDSAGRGVVTVSLHNVANVQTLSVTLSGLTDGTSSGSISIPMGVLLGDTTGDRTVNSADASQTKARSGQVLSSSNFRSDVTADGTINSADASLVKSRSGTALP